MRFNMSARNNRDQDLQTHIPSSFGVYHRKMRSMALKTSKDADPFLLLDVHNAVSSKPTLVLKSAATRNVKATANFPFLSVHRRADLAVGDLSGILTWKLRSFSLKCLNEDGTEEVFRWKRSSGPEVRDLNGRRRGWKLVREANKEVIAVWTKCQRSHLSWNKMAKVKLLQPGYQWGRKWEDMFVLSALAVIKVCRDRSDSALNMSALNMEALEMQ